MYKYMLLALFMAFSLNCSAMDIFEHTNVLNVGEYIDLDEGFDM